MNKRFHIFWSWHYRYVLVILFVSHTGSFPRCKWPWDIYRVCEPSTTSWATARGKTLTRWEVSPWAGLDGSVLCEMWAKPTLCGPCVRGCLKPWGRVTLATAAELLKAYLHTDSSLWYLHPSVIFHPLRRGQNNLFMLVLHMLQQELSSPSDWVISTKDSFPFHVFQAPKFKLTFLKF